jgi:hypothetical protein
MPILALLSRSVGAVNLTCSSNIGNGGAAAARQAGAHAGPMSVHNAAARNPGLPRTKSKHTHFFDTDAASSTGFWMRSSL